MIDGRFIAQKVAGNSVQMSARISEQQARRIMAQNIHKFEVLKDVTILANGKPLLSYSIIDALKAGDHSLKVDLGNVIDVKNGLVGIPGAHYRPYVVGTRDAPNALAAWRWFDDKLGGSYTHVAAFIGGGYIVRAMMGGPLDITPIIPIFLANNAYVLRYSRSIQRKMAEFRKRIRGNLKTLKRASAAESFAHAFKMIDQLEDMNSEMLFGRLAKECGHKVDPDKLPDLYVDGIKVEVKNVRGSHINTRKIQELFEIAFERQGAELAAFHVGGDLAWDLRLRRERDPIKFCFAKVLEKGLRFARTGRRCAVVFTYNFWDRNLAAGLLVQ